MAKKIFKYRGKTIEELQALNLNEFIELLPAREKRSLKRGYTEEQKKFLKKMESGSSKLKTHCRELVITPNMIGKTIGVHAGNRFDPVVVVEEMIAHRLGEFVLTRKRLTHSAPGVGATKSSSAVSVK